MVTLEHILSQPYDIELSMYYVNTFFVIMGIQIIYLVETLYREGLEQNKNIH